MKLNEIHNWMTEATIKCPRCGTEPFQHTDLGYTHKCHVCGKTWRQQQENEETDEDDICGFCGQPGADKIPHPVRWPGEESAGTKYVHADCEREACGRAHAALSDKQRAAFLRTL